MKFNAKLVPLLAFFAYLIKIITVSPSFPDSIVILGLIGYVIADYLHLKDRKIEEFRSELKTLKDILEKQALDLRNLQSKTSAISLGQGMRPLNMNSQPKVEQKKSEW